MNKSNEYGDSRSDRRRYPRGAGKIPLLTLRITAEESCDAEIVDESLTGISLLVQDAVNIQVGQEVRLSHGERSVQVIVKHVRPRKQGGYHLGLQWGPCEVKPASLLLLLPKA